MTRTLTEFCQDVEKNGEKIRCCSCGNTLAMAGNYEIQTIEDKIIPFLPAGTPVEGLVCDRCVQVGRKALKAVVISGENQDNERVTYVNIDDLAKAGTAEAPPPATEEETTPAIKS